MDHIRPPRMLKGVKRRQRIPEMPDMKGIKVLMNGRNRPRTTARGPHLSISPSVLAIRSGVSDFTRPERTMARPKKCPMK